MNTLMLGWLQGWEILALVLLVLLLFGAKKLPELARGLGSGIKEFRKATRDGTDETQSASEPEPNPPGRPSRPPGTPSEGQPRTPGEKSSSS